MLAVLNTLLASMTLRQIIHIVLAVAVAGFLIYLIMHYTPMPQPIKMGLSVLICVLFVLWFIDNVDLGLGSF